MQGATVWRGRIEIDPGEVFDLPTARRPTGGGGSSSDKMRTPTESQPHGDPSLPLHFPRFPTQEVRQIKTKMWDRNQNFKKCPGIGSASKSFQNLLFQGY